MRHAVNQRNCPTQKRAPLEARRYPPHSSNGAQLRETFEAAAKVLDDLPAADNAEGAVEKMLRANALLRHLPWPKPFDLGESISSNATYGQQHRLCRNSSPMSRSRK